MSEYFSRSTEESSSISSDFFSSYSSSIMIQCDKLLTLVLNKTNPLNDQQVLPIYFQQSLTKKNLTFHLPKTKIECIMELTRLINSTYDLNTTIKINKQYYRIEKHSNSLIIFIILISFVSLISIIGNLCLTKVLYSKRYRLLQTDKIVLCLALSELCLVLIDTPTEIYRFLSYSFTQEWLCRFHTFFEGFFSSCIIFYHLLGAFDRFIYLHGHKSLNNCSWSKWSRRLSTKFGSIIILILPLIFSFPIAICNTIHAHILHKSLINKICIVQYTHGILISLLISFYILPLLFSFFLHGKLIYFIRTRNNQYYITKTEYIIPMKRNNNTNLIETRSNRRLNNNKENFNEKFLLPRKNSFDQRIIRINTEIISPITTTTTTATTMGAGQLIKLKSNRNPSLYSSQSSRSSIISNSINKRTKPIIFYKLNSQVNANANRTVLLLLLLLSFYVFCWSPYNIYTWYHAYQLTQSSSLLFNSKINNLTTSFYDLNQTLIINNDLRRIIFINYSLYLLSMISMCFSFIFYFLLNKQARHEFLCFIRCFCPWIIHIPNKQQREQFLKQKNIKRKKLKYKNERMKLNQPTLINKKYVNHIRNKNYSQNLILKRTTINYDCQIQCCT